MLVRLRRGFATTSGCGSQKSSGCCEYVWLNVFGAAFCFSILDTSKVYCVAIFFDAINQYAVFSGKLKCCPLQLVSGYVVVGSMVNMHIGVPRASHCRRTIPLHLTFLLWTLSSSIGDLACICRWRRLATSAKWLQHRRSLLMTAIPIKAQHLFLNADLTGWCRARLS